MPQRKIPGLCFSVGTKEWKVERALRLAAKDTSIIRTYSPESYAGYALKLGLEVVPGIWLDRNHEQNKKNIAHGISYAWEHRPKLIVLGNETLLRGDLAPQELVAYIQEVKTRLPQETMITTADVARFLIDHPDVIDTCDIVGMHHYPFWDGVHIDHAIKDLTRMYRRVKKVARGKRVTVLETGWPSGGGTRGAALASRANARAYFRGVMQWAEKSNVLVFWFEAFDEKWKIDTEGPPGVHWGLRGELTRKSQVSRRKYWLEQ